MDIPEPSHLLPGTDARADHRPQILPVIGALFSFSSEQHQNVTVSGAAVKDEKVAVDLGGTAHDFRGADGHHLYKAIHAHASNKIILHFRFPFLALK